MFAHSIHISIFEVRKYSNQSILINFNEFKIRPCACGLLILLISSVFADPHNQGFFISIHQRLNNSKMRKHYPNVLNANNSSIVDNSEILTYEFADTLKMLSLCIEDKASALLCCLANKKELEKNLSQIIALSRSINRAIDADEFQDLGDILTILSNHYQNQI